MQRIKNTRWMPRNPIGDTLFYKLKAVTGGRMAISIGNTFTRMAAPLQINDGLAFFTTYGAVPGMSLASNFYQQYKIRGLKLKITYWPIAPNTQPLCGWTLASQQSSAVSAITPDINNIGEQRWGKYRTLTFPGQGASPVTLNVYYSEGKIWGPDNTEKNSVNFTSSTVVTSPFFNTPAAGTFYDHGIFIMNGFPATATIQVDYKIEVTAYIKYWSKRALTG